MDTPNYILRTNQIMSVVKIQILDRIQALLMLLTIFIVGGWIFGFSLVLIIPLQIRLLIIAISIGIYSIPNKKSILAPFEIQFYDDYLIIYHERYHPVPDRKLYEKIFYRDIQRCQYKRKEKKFEIFCIVQRIFYIEERNGRYSDALPKLPKRSMCVFYTNVEPIIDFVQEIQSHSPIEVTILD